MNIIRLTALGTLTLSLTLHSQAQAPSPAAVAQDYASVKKAVDDNNAKISKLNDLILQARAAKAKNDFDTAASLMQQAVAIKPDEPLLWLMLGDAQVGQKRFQEAGPSYKKVIELTEATKKNLDLGAQARYALGQLNDKSSDTSPAAVSPAPTSGPTMDETIAFINEAFSKQGKINFVKPDYAGLHFSFTNQKIAQSGPCEFTFTDTLVNAETEVVRLDLADPRTMRVEKQLDDDPVIYSPTVQQPQNDGAQQLNLNTQPLLGFFTSEDTANRAAKAYIHAIVLCHKPEAPSPF
jgi:tetratricopeptide (TPR) repeat protein